MDPGTIAEGLVKNPLAWFCALLLLAVIYLFKELRAENVRAIERMEKEKAVREATLERIIPIAEKLTTAVEVLERLALRET